MGQYAAGFARKKCRSVGIPLGNSPCGPQRLRGLPLYAVSGRDIDEVVISTPRFEALKQLVPVNGT